MKFVLLGTGTLVPDQDRGPAGFLVDTPAAKILVDGGSGTLQRLKQYGVDARELDAGVYSHRHLDHCGDLGPLLFAMRVGIDRPRRESYPIWAGAGFRSFLDQLEQAYAGWIRSDSFAAEVHELSLDKPEEVLLPGGVTLATLPARHTAGALHLRFTSPEGKRVVFSGDTGPSENLKILAKDVDLLVCECATAVPDPWDSHLCPKDVVALVEASRPKRVVLTHFYPGTDPETVVAMVAATGVPVERGWDGQVLEV